MGSSCCAMRNKTLRYQKVGDINGREVLLELSREGDRGIYWFSFAIDDEIIAPTPLPPKHIKTPPTHRLNKRTKAVISSAKELCVAFKDERYSQWTSIHKNDEFELFKNRYEKYVATCSCDGVTAHEICTEFWNTDPKFKLEWDSSVEKCVKLEELSPTCHIIHLIMKRVWPTKQRDCVMCSEILRISESTWAVCNYSLEDYTSPLIQPPKDCIRSSSTVVLIAEDHLIDPNKPYTRENMCTEIIYQAHIDPGGWLPANLVNSVSRKAWSAVLRCLCQNTVQRVALPRPLDDNEVFYDGDEMNIFN